MRPVLAFFLVVAVLGGFAGFERATRFAPGEDVQVEALTRDPVRVVLDFSPTTDEIADAVTAQLRVAAASESNPDLAAELESLAGDTGFVAEVAATSAERLRTDAAALAFSTTATNGEGDRITIAAVTIEILPRGRSDGISRAHEDGHATINNGIVQRCGATIVSYEVDRGKTGNDLMSAINDHISLLEDRAHAQYHASVTNQVFGSHGPAASRSLSTLERAGCLAY